MGIKSILFTSSVLCPFCVALTCKQVTLTSCSITDADFPIDNTMLDERINHCTGDCLLIRGRLYSAIIILLLCLYYVI